MSAGPIALENAVRELYAAADRLEAHRAAVEDMERRPMSERIKLARRLKPGFDVDVKEAQALSDAVKKQQMLAIGLGQSSIPLVRSAIAANKTHEERELQAREREKADADANRLPEG